ncbi:MAG TPA: STAS domain-containing protein [Thermoleophilia bacterium]|nr:STAS domain-containing protein [Thermoleophilia bacterium]
MKPDADVRLTISVEQDLIAVCVDGNLDYCTAPLVRERIDQAMTGRARLVEVRLGAINVIDSSGLSVLIYAYKLARARGKELVLRGETDTVARLLHRTSLDRVIPLRPPRRPPLETHTDSAASA